MAAAVPTTTSPSPDPAVDPPPSPLSPPELSPSAHRQLLPPPVAPRRLAPPCWTQEETLALIDAYGDKWRALRRGHLRASHWQEVADALRRRCQRPAAAGPKTAVQCRHKVEKLRQRYRAEKQRLAIRGKPRSSSWVYFPMMDAMELGTSVGDGGAAAPPAAAPSSSSGDGEGDHNTGGGDPKSAAHMSQGFMPKTNGVGAFDFRVPKALRSKVSAPSGATARPKLSNGFLPRVPRPKAGEETGERGEETKKGGLVWEMVAAVEMLGDEFVKVEEMKMEMARDVERLRREMELKRTEMILDSQRRIAEYIIGLHEKKRVKVAPKS